MYTQHDVSKSKKPEKVVGRGRGLLHRNSSHEVGKSGTNLSVTKESSEKPTGMPNIYSERRSFHEDNSTGDTLMCTQHGVSKSKKLEKVLGRGRGLFHTDSSRGSRKV